MTTLATSEYGARVTTAYDGSSIVLRALRACGWNNLLNLGYFRLRDLPRVVTGLEYFQRRLATESIALLEVSPTDVVVDVACGYGWTTDLIARRARRAVGIDVVRAHVDAAGQRFGGANRRFVHADGRDVVAALEPCGLGPGSVDKIHCLEAAFHFGAEGRQRFLDSAFRALRPGGTLVLVDLVYGGAERPPIDDLDPRHIVRDTWQFEDFELLPRYLEMAATAGFEPDPVVDWTRPVFRLQAVGDTMVSLSFNRVARRVLGLMVPGLRDFTPADWEHNAEVVRALGGVRAHLKYVALVLRKP